MPRMGHGPMKNVPSNEKAKDFKGTIMNIITYIKPFKIPIIIVILFSILGSLFSIIGPKILGNATTIIFEGFVSKINGTGAIDFQQIENILLFLLVLYILSMIFSFFQSYIMSSVSQKISYQLRKEISKKLNHLPMHYFDTKTNGEILSRITNDVDTVSQNLSQSISQIISAITLLIGILIMMFSISPLMSIVTIIILPLSSLFISFVVKQSQKYFQMQQEYLGHVNGQVEEIYGGHIIVKAFNAEEKVILEFDEINETLYNSAWKSQFLSGMMHPIMTFVGNISYVMVSILGGYLTIKNKIAVGDILSFTQYARTFMQPLGTIAQVTNLLQSTAAAAERVFEFLNEEEESANVKNAVSTKHIEGKITFEHVKFGYNKEKTIINDFSAKIKKGQKIAIVGPTGAGKTTIVKLLMRFYDVNSGSIKIDGYDIRNFNRGELRKLFGMVLQDVWLFNDTILENIRYGNLNATNEEVINAAKRAHVDHFVQTLPDTYNMELNEDATNISQGQKQLLTIARVILADPKILILDEATSSVDTRTELLIQKAMDEVMKGRTSFIIAHRLSTIKNADLILVMDHGDIVEQGCHEELLSKNGFYANLYNSQFEEVIE